MKEIYRVVSPWRFSNQKQCFASFMVWSQIHQKAPRLIPIDHKENSKSWEEIISKDEQARPHAQKFGCKVLTPLHRLSKQSDEMLWPCGLLQAPKKPGSSLRSAPSSPYLLW